MSQHERNEWAKQLIHMNLEQNELYHHGILGMHWGVRRFQPYPSDYKGDGKYVGKESQRPNPAKLSKYSNARWENQREFLGTTSGTTKMDFGNKKMRVYASDIKTAGRIMDRIDRDEKKITSSVNDAVIKAIKDTKRRETTYGEKATADYLSKRNPYETLAIDGITILNSSGRGKDKIAVFVRDNVTGDLWETDLDATTLKILEEPWIEG